MENQRRLTVMDKLSLEEILEKYIPESELSEVKRIMYGRDFM